MTGLVSAPAQIGATNPQTLAGAPAGPVISSRRYYPLVDVLRVVAIVDIIAYHIDPVHARPLLGIGLPAFLLLSVTFAARHVQMSTADYLFGRAKRLLVPWAICFGIYGILELRDRTQMGHPLIQASDWPQLLAGPAYHLWFLPFAFVTAVATQWLARRTAHWRRAATIPVMVTVGAGTVLLRLTLGNPRIDPFPQWGYWLTSIPIGVVLGRILWDSTARHRSAIMMALGLVLLILGIAAHRPQGDGVSARYLMACGAVLLACSISGRSAPAFRWVGSLVYGVYLLHPLVIRELNHVSGLRRGFAFEIVLVTMISTVMTWLILQAMRARPAQFFGQPQVNGA